MRPLVSIIIPAYNCEAYIGKCIESILIQSYKNIEIIIVNDGSVDNTEEVIKKYILNDNRIKYFTQNNSGPSIARNKGIEKADGKYLMFIDSDDLVNYLYVERLVREIESGNYDIACCGYVDESKYGVIKLNDFWNGKGTLNKQEFLKCVCNGVGGVLWAKIFRRDIIFDNDIRMDPKIFMSEDLIFILEYCKYSKRFRAIDENLYYYNRLNDNSISSNIDINYLENYILLVNKIKELLIYLKVDYNNVNTIEVLKIQDLINKVIISESNKYLKSKNKKMFINNINIILNDKFIKEYKNRFFDNSRIDKVNNYFIKKGKYKSLLSLNVLIIHLKKVKDKVLRR